MELTHPELTVTAQTECIDTPTDGHVGQGMTPENITGLCKEVHGVQVEGQSI